MIREKQTRSGRLFEADFYPVFADGRRVPTRAPKTKPSTAEQIRYNHLQAVKQLVRIVNENFDETDYYMHPTYAPENAPQSEEEARRDITNFFRRIRTRRASEAKSLRRELAEAEEAASKMPENAFLASAVEKLKGKIAKLEAPFKYVYAIEEQIYKRGRYAGRSNWHFHLFQTGGLSLKELKQMWPGGICVKCENYDPHKFGPEAAALYMCKDPRGSKRYVCSRNICKPKPPEIKDGSVTARTVERTAKQRVDDRKYWERRYKGYKFVRCYSRYNPYNGNWYVSVVMYKTDGAPPRWKADDWITSDYTA